MRILTSRLREEVFALLPQGVEVRFLDEPWPRTADLFLPPFGQEEVVRRVLAEVEVRVVQTLSAGVDWILPLLPPGVVLCDGSGIHDVPVAEWVVLALLSLLKDLPGFLEAQREGRWAPRRLPDLEGQTVLLLGYGAIGKAVEARLRPFGVELLPVARHPRPGVYTPKDLPHLLPRADAVVLLLPLTPETRGMVDQDFLARLKPGALLVNAGRGPLVDTEALLKALEAGRVRAFLDVTDPEPLPEGHPLWRAKGVVITPHVAGLSQGFSRRAARFLAEQVGRYLRGEPLLNVVREGY
ncbi:MAG: 2-hydroxyacid dehydrogenase [Thermus sp.]|uniref:2-hydroxyacid dehydrogenase n=1 Tax=Thermus sp. TaxID=275 RepID=UPI0025CED7D4|nr:2-hydroxyacid dehydrogenase [Thermus sp.]MCS6868591.1 2-hydroxyacid dehydrogenase [Thermus sp.]MCS7218448.1 2-hydroxyacid dehydrogenase [Thermus sp.]MDW8356948.1 2-hydroxyacid dehydrogenase [Thermus sp.]